LTITIEGPSQNDLNQSRDLLAKAIDGARMNINNGAKIKRSWTNGEDPRAMMALMGQLKWWSLGRIESPVKHQKKRSLFSNLLEGVGKEIRKANIPKEIRSLYEDEPEI
jgi:hypothetical protein